MTKDETELRRLNAQIDKLTIKRNALRRRVVERKARFKDGDLVVYGKFVYRLAVHVDGLEPAYFGRKLKKDGYPGMHSGRLYEWGSNKIRPATPDEVLARKALS